jgi:hypothetical protein
MGKAHPAYLQISEHVLEDADDILIAHVYNQAQIQSEEVTAASCEVSAAVATSTS